MKSFFIFIYAFVVGWWAASLLHAWCHAEDKKAFLRGMMLWKKKEKSMTTEEELLHDQIAQLENTARDQFALAAMPWAMENSADDHCNGLNWQQVAAKISYAIADAMLEERKLHL